MTAIPQTSNGILHLVIQRDDLTEVRIGPVMDPLTDYVTGYSEVAQDRCGPGSRFRKCKIGATVDLACDNGACGAAPLRIDARHPLARFY
jgi:hypothetical protein